MRNGLFAFAPYFGNTNSTKETFAEVPFDIAPNPFIDKIQISSEFFETGKATFKLYDLNGRLIFDQTSDLNKGQNQLDIDLPDNLKQGIYLFELIQENVKLNGKLIK